MKQALFFALAVALVGADALPASAASEAASRNGITVAGRDGQALDAEGTRAAIILGAKRARWIVLSDQPGSIRLRFREAERKSGDILIDLDVPYGGGQFALRYVDSSGISVRRREAGRDRRAGGRYDILLDTLVQSIRAAAKRGASGNSAAAPAPAADGSWGTKLEDLPHSSEGKAR